MCQPSVEPQAEVLGSLPAAPHKYWIIHGQAYDLGTWVASHPGGADAILLGRGRDCTELFEQYHVLNTKHLHVLKRFRVDGLSADGLGAKASAVGQPKQQPAAYIDSPHGVDSGADAGSDDESNRPGSSSDADSEPKLSPQASSVPPELDAFYEDIKLMVRDHAKAYGNLKLSTAFVALQVLHVAGLAWAFYMWAHGHLLAAVMLPYFLWVLNAALVHDGGHFALSRTAWVNNWLNFTAALITNSTGCWYLQHNVLHHAYTNLLGMDGDLDSHHPYMRIHPEQTMVPTTVHHALRCLSHLGMYIFAHIGLTMIAPISYFRSLLSKEPADAKTSENLTTLRHHHLGICIQMACTVAFYAYPFFVFSFGRAFLLSFFPFFIMSIAFMVIAQVSHIQLDAEGPSAELEQMHWARRMACTSVDYSQDSWLWCYLTIGLNMQSLHHILPGVSYSQLPRLYPAYRQLCAKHGITLLERRNLWHALCTHVTALWELSKTHSLAQLAKKAA